MSLTHSSHPHAAERDIPAMSADGATPIAIDLVMTKAQGITGFARAWKDTIHVPVDATRRFLVKLDRPGSWMFHCHILDHAEAGLMSTVDVGDDIGVPHGEHAH